MPYHGACVADKEVQVQYVDPHLSYQECRQGKGEDECIADQENQVQQVDLHSKG